MEGPVIRVALRVVSAGVLLFLYLPLLVIVLYAFNESKIATWPIDHYSTKWFSEAWSDQRARDALLTTIKVALLATGIAMVLGTAAAFALARFSFFGKNVISFVLVLPIALPGIVTGLALLSGMNFFGIQGSVLTIAMGHATFCIVIIFNNAVARLRRTSLSLGEASMDLGADGWQTFRYVTLPSLYSALLAGGLLALALSFDEVIVTYFTAQSQETLPLWIFNQFTLPNKVPEVNAVAVVIILATAIPVLLAQRLMRDEGGLSGR